MDWPQLVWPQLVDWPQLPAAPLLQPWAAVVRTERLLDPSASLLIWHFITLWPAARMSKTSSTCPSQTFVLRCTCCCEDGASYPSFLPLFLKPARKRNGGELSESQQRTSKGALWQPSARGREFCLSSPPQPPKSGHLPGNEIFSFPRCWPVPRDIRWEAEKGSHVSLWSPECWEEPPKIQIPRLLGYLKSYWKFQSSRAMTGKGSFPSGWLFYESIPKPTDEKLFWPLPLLQFSLAAMMVMKYRRKGLFAFSAGNSLCLAVSSVVHLKLMFPSQQTSPQPSLGLAPTTIQAELDFFSVSGPLSKS